MNKLFLLLVMSFLVFGIALSFPIVIAGEDDNNSVSSDSGSDSSKTDSDDEDKDEDEDDEDRSGERDRFKEEIKREFIDESGNRVKIERKIEIKDGEVKIEIKRKIVDSDGNEIEIKIKIEEKDGRRKIHIEGKEEFSVETELEIETEFEGNESDLGALTSDGKRHRIKIMPDRASEIAIERLKSKNFTIELREVLHKNIPRVVYNIETNKNGRFLGVFKLKIKIEGEIDPETGEIISINKPWWAFLVTGEDSDQTEGDSDQIEEENQITVELTEENSSGEFGTATLAKENGQVIVTLSMIGAPENVFQPVHIHVGSCPEVGEVKYPLTNVLDGESVTTLDVTLEQLEIELPLAINVHKSVTEASVYVSCGDIQF